MLSIPQTVVSTPHRLLNQIHVPADWIGLRIVKNTTFNRRVRDGKPQENSRRMTYGAMVEVLQGGQIGYGATSSLSPDAVQAAAQSALIQARAAQAWSLSPFQATVRPRVTGEFIAPVRQALDSLSPKEVNALLVRICQKLKLSDQIVQTSATAIATERETWFVSSNGSDVYQHTTSVSTDYDATAKDGSITQKRSANGWFAKAYQGGWEMLLTDTLWAEVQQVGEEAIALLSAPDCPNETLRLVLAPDQMMLQIHESVGHPLELDRILGDERNYAGGSFVRPQDFGSLRYGSPLMNITFDPTVPGELASYGFDDTGMVAERQFLIQDGLLQRGLGGIESQTRSQLPGVACARASSWNRPPTDRMANLNLEPGDSSFAEIIRNTERGVLMRSNCSWSIDDQRYKFQFGCEYGQMIENGEITQTVKNPNYRSTTPEFWRSLSEVGDRSTWEVFGTPMCGKGEPNQIIWVGHGAPVCAFETIEVFGGGG
ncbi:MAG: TldD/PmbA family protein [Synechococcales cyanobacterium CRU_2_2]|nr:TldD/PmbA family protein [Synechococcales cyanobacterium CRU_2_2]